MQSMNDNKTHDITAGLIAQHIYGVLYYYYACSHT